MEDSEITKIQPDERSGAGLLQQAINLGIGKCKTTGGRTFILAIFAGAFIGFGAAFYCLVAAGNVNFVVNKVVGGMAFCLGLILVLCCGSELFTGNCLLFIPALSKKITWGGLFKNWGIVWVGNFVGSLLAVAVIAGAAVPFTKVGDTTIAATMVSVAAGKQALVFQPLTLICKAIMCNVLVCLAVWIAWSGKTVVDKVFGVLFPITAFVALGFEHCVANMFFLPMGFMLNNLYGITGGTATAAGMINLGGVIGNILIATVGNIIGGGIFVGCLYWLAYHKKEVA
jgi:formate/nitrite transporter